MRILLNAEIEISQVVEVEFFPTSRGVGMRVDDRYYSFDYYEFKALLDIIRGQRENEKNRT